MDRIPRQRRADFTVSTVFDTSYHYQKVCLCDFRANYAEPLDRDCYLDENFLSRRYVSIAVNTKKGNAMKTELSRCAD